MAGAKDLEHSQLTRREREVAELVTLGHTSQEIGVLLGISPRTVECHRARLMRKLNARSAATLAAQMVAVGAASAPRKDPPEAQFTSIGQRLSKLQADIEANGAMLLRLLDKVENKANGCC